MLQCSSKIQVCIIVAQLVPMVGGGPDGSFDMIVFFSALLSIAAGDLAYQTKDMRAVVADREGRGLP